MARVVSPEELEIKDSQSSDEGLHQPLPQEPADYNSITPITRDEPAEVEEKRSCYRQKGSLYEHAVYFACLATASYAGVLIRIYLSELANWDGVALFPSLYPQIVGTLIMGFICSHKRLLATRHAFFYQAIATGLCGSITTFSSWNSEAVSSLLQTGQNPPDNIVRVLAWGTTLFLGVGMSSASLSVGRHLALLSPWSDSKRRRPPSTKTSSPCCNVSTVEGTVFLSLWIVATLLVAVVPYVLGRQELVFTCILASFGTYVRWHLAPLNSAFLNKFKLGTFLVNVGGAWLLGGVVCVRDLYTEEPLLHDALVGLATGFCGCLTTVSTFALELSSLPVKSSYLYAFTSIALAQLGLVLIRGTVQWTTDYL